MEFSGQYLTYNDYKSLGGTLDLTSFNLLEFEARRKIDERTLNRLKGIETKDIPEEVKICVFALINSLGSYSSSINTNNKNVASESTDGYSISYVTGGSLQEIVKSKSAELEDIIRTYLMGIVVKGEHIMYLGV